MLLMMMLLFKKMQRVLWVPDNHQNAPCCLMMMTRMFMISDINDDTKDANKNKMIFMIKHVEDVLDQKSGSCCLIVLMQKRTRRIVIFVDDQDAEYGTAADEDLLSAEDFFIQPTVQRNLRC